MTKHKSFYGFREKGSSNYQSFALEIIAGCQLKCGNCYRAAKLGLNPMPREFVERMIKEAKEAGFAEIVLIGGEPTLHSQLPEFMQSVLDACLTPILCTNGVKLADRVYCEEVALPGSIIVVHGLVPTPFMDQHVGLDGYMERLKKAYLHLEHLRLKRVTIVSEAVVVKPFIPYLVEFHKWCRENNYFPFIELNRRGNDGRLNGLSVSPEEVYRLFQELQNWDLEHEPDLADNFLTPPAYGIKCTMSITGLHVKNFGGGDYGGVYSCCAQHIQHGNLLQQPLEEVLADTTMEVFKNQDKWIYGPCRDCQHYSLCRGGCRGEAFLAFGCPRASCPACWHISPQVRDDPAIMIPPTCVGCPLEGNPTCHPRRSAGN